VRRVLLAIILALAAPVTLHAEGPAVQVLAPPPAPPLGASSVDLGPPPDLSPFAGKAVTFAEIVVDDDFWEDTVAPPITKARAGDTFTPALARAALLEAMDTGLFGSARVDVKPEPGGVRIVIHGVPRKIVESLEIDLHGMPLEADEILREGGLEEGAELVGYDVRTRKRRVEALLARRGFTAATVRISTRQTDRATRVIVLLDVTPNAPRLLARRVLYPIGAAREDLAGQLESYDVDKGDRVDEPALEAADVTLEAKLRTAGWYDARVSHDVVLASGVVTLRVRVDAGPKYVLRFDGNAHYDADALLAALATESDPDRSPLHLAEKLRGFYEARGWLDSAITPELRGLPTEPTRYVFFHVIEGARVLAVARTYPCLHEADVKGLSGGGPRSASDIGREIDSYLEEELPGADLIRNPDPRGVDTVLGGPQTPRGAQRVPTDLDPNRTFSPGTYDRAVAHVQELYRNEGFLGALVGPVQVLRQRCDPRSAPGTCTPLAYDTAPPDTCAYETTGSPLPTKPLDASFTCVPDRDRGIACEDRVSLRIPVKLGPRTFLHDLSFTGARSIEEKKLAEAAAIRLGDPANTVKIEEAKRRIIDLYKEEGFYYVDVRTSLERSLDATRARVHFELNEGERVYVGQILVRGNRLTDEAVIRKRIALVVNQPFRTSDVRKTQERVATLNVFASVTVALQNPTIPEHSKTVIVTVVENTPQYVELRPGFSSGEGVRAVFEYGHRNLFGSATSLAFRAQVSYLPDFLISDQSIAANYQALSIAQRLATRVSISLGLPNVGLGPVVRAGVDAVFLREVQRYFTISKGALIPSLYFRPVRQLLFTLSASAELNNLFVFGNKSYQDAVAQSGGNLDVQRLLRVPDGESYVISQRLTMAWDRRDSSFNAHSGTYLLLGVEHADSLPIGNTQAVDEGHFLRLAQTFSGYVPLTAKIGLALTMRLGQIVQLVPTSSTYPDRYFFMGGFDSMRSYQQESMIPQDAVDQIDAGKIKLENVAVRGGNLLVNPRAELRIPIAGPIETVIFFDSGNLWQNATYPFEHGVTFRAAAGTGIRIQTPVGPLALDYGFNLTKKSYEDIGALNFAIGLF